MRPEQRLWFVLLVGIGAALAYMMACGLASADGFGGAPFTWWHPGAVVAVLLLGSGVLVIERMTAPPRELTPDETDLLKRYRKGGP